MTFNRPVIGDCRAVLPTLPERSYRCCVTSPPYWGLRDYGHADQIGLEPTPEQYVESLVSVFREVRRVLTDDGTLWLNVGDSYAAAAKGSCGTKSKQPTNAGSFYTSRFDLQSCGLKPKDLVGIPWRLAFALQADGWWLRSDIIWHKPNPMPESVTDRPTKAHEYVFLLAKSERYYFDAPAIAEKLSGDGRGGFYSNSSSYRLETQTGGASSGERRREWGRNARTVWSITSRPYSGAHFATMPPELARRCIAAGSAQGDAVLDPFFGTGTVGEMAASMGRRWTGIDLSYEDLSAERTNVLQFGAEP